MTVPIPAIPSSFPCPTDDIFSLPTKDDLVNGITDIAKIPSDLRVFLVQVGDQITEEAKQEIEDTIEDIEKFIEDLGDLLSPYWEKGTVRDWRKEANDAITELIQEFHLYIPTKIAELVSKLTPISLTISIMGLSIDITQIFNKEYQQTLKDQIGGITPDFKKKLAELQEDFQNDKISFDEYEEKMQELMESKSKIIDKFFAFIPEKLRGFDAKFGVKCDEWKAKMTWQYIKTKIQEFLTNGLHAAFGALIDLFDEIWDVLNLPGLVALFTKPDVGALIDAIVETLNEKRKKLLKELEDPLVSDERVAEIQAELDELGTTIRDKIMNFSLFGFSIKSIIGDVKEEAKSLEEAVLEMKLAMEDFVQNWQKKLLMDWVKKVKKFFDKIGLKKLFSFLSLTFCDVLKILGFPFDINVKTPNITGVTTPKQTDTTDTSTVSTDNTPPVGANGY